MAITTTATIINPDHIPALKIPPTNSQLLNVVANNAISVKGIYLFIC